MIIYVIIAFVAILIGMAISVSAFGTGGKRKKIFQDIYFSVEDVDGIGVLYTKTGEYSAILKMENPVQKYSANIDSYYEFNHLVTALAQTLGEGYAIHKQDARISSSVLPSQSKPVFSLMASRIGRRRYGALKLMMLPSISRSGLPFTAIQIVSSNFSVKAIIQL